MKTRGVLAALILALLAASAAAQTEAPKPEPKPEPKHDVVVLDNGDMLHGTVKTAGGGKLVLQTDYAGAVTIKIEKIKTLSTVNPVKVQLPDKTEFEAKIVEIRDKALVLEPVGEQEPRNLKWEEIQGINPPPPATLRGNIAFGAAILKGNVDRLTLSASAEVERKSDVDRFTMRFLWQYAEEDDELTARNVFAGAKHDFFLAKKLYGYFAVDLFSDEFKDLELRVVAGAGFGYQLIGEKEIDLGVEAGISYVRENFKVAENDDRATLRLAQNFRWTILDAIMLTDRTECYPSLEDSQYQVRNEASLTSGLIKGLGLKFSNIIDYDSDPSPGVKKLDVTWLISLSFSFS